MEWSDHGSFFTLSTKVDNLPKLPDGVYNLKWSSKMDKYVLKNLQKEFAFSHKIYNLDKTFIDRVTKTYNNTKNNLGILLHGTRGTGKTVTAKLICNELKLPVLIVNQAYNDLPTFINLIQQDVIIFIDEYEKTYRNNKDSLLSLMDGVLSNEYRRVFLLTTNNTFISENMLQRPGRIRYKKAYEDLTLDTITEIVDDLLIHKEFRENTIEFFSKLNLITVDVVKSVVEEINIHKEPAGSFVDIFNVKKIQTLYNIYRVSEDGTEKLHLTRREEKILEKGPFDINDAGKHCSVGIIEKVISEYKAFIVSYQDDWGSDDKIEYTYRFEKMTSDKHKAYIK